MMIRFRSPFVVCFVTICWCYFQSCHCLDVPSSSSASSSSRRSWLTRQISIAAAGLTTTAAAAAAGGGSIAAAALAADDEDAFNNNNKNKNGNPLKLVPPTDEQPRIELPTRASQDADQPLVQGLIFLKNPRLTRPPANAVVLVTVRKVSDPDQILLAAQIPIASQRLPLQFQFPSPRKGGPRGGSTTAITETDDLLVKANVCLPENVNRTTKTCSNTILSGKGIAKALTFQPNDNNTNSGLPTSTRVSFRAGVSIALVEEAS